MRKRKINSVLSENWLPVLFGAVASIGLLALFLFGYKEITPQVLPSEINVLNTPMSEVLRSPLYLHQLIIQKFAGLFGLGSVISVRLPAIITGFVVIITYYLITKTWFSRRTAIIGSILFASSSWMLHITRLGTPDVNFLLLIVPVYALVLIHNNKYSLRGALLLLISSLTLLYIPGLIWFVLPVIIWRRKLLIKTIKNVSPYAIGGISLLVVIGLIPALVAAIHDPSFILKIAGLSLDATALTNTPNVLINGVMEVFITRDYNPQFGIATIPYLNIATSVLALLGVTYAFKEKKLDRSKVVVTAFVLGFVLHGISNGAVSVAIVLPFVFLLVAGGVAFLIRKWLSVFPKNPVAGKVALSCITVLVGITVYYETTRYFIAWPHSDGYSSIFKQTDN